MRRSAFPLLALLAAVLAAGCSAAGAGPDRATVGNCYVFGVHAIERHITVTAIPPACAGLGQEQTNLAAGRAIATMSRTGPKAVVRRHALQDSVYLARLIRAIPPSSSVPAATALAGQPAGRSAGVGASGLGSSGLTLRLAALAVWILTAAAGGYLLADLLRSAGTRRRLPAVAVAHAGLALTGLGVWVGFVASDVAALAWVAVGIVNIVAALGIAALLGAPPRAQTDGRGTPAFVIALHGLAATTAIFLVLTAALSTT